MFEGKKIGELLQQAYLIDEQQLQVALAEKDFYPELKLGEILVLHGWLREETADFFGNKIKIIKPEKNLLIGNIFLQAGLLSEDNIRDILHEQKQIGLRFGEIAALKGLIKKETMTFFIDNFALYKNKQDYYQYKKQQLLSESQNNQIKNNIKNFKNNKNNPFIYPVHEPQKVTVVDLDEIKWIG